MGKTVYTWSGNRAKMLFLLCRVDTFAVIVGTRRRKHKAGGAALGLSCAGCFEELAGVFANSVAAILPSLAGVFASDEMIFLEVLACKDWTITKKRRIAMPYALVGFHIYSVDSTTFQLPQQKVLLPVQSLQLPHLNS